MAELKTKIHWAIIPQHATTLRDALVYRSRTAAERKRREMDCPSDWYIVIPVIRSDGRKEADRAL
jgi:hypothetical protein